MSSATGDWGAHSCSRDISQSLCLDLPFAPGDQRFFQPPFLTFFSGKLPPFLLVAGDRRRVLKIASHLTDAVILHDLPVNPGRVSAAIGLFEGVPIGVVETGMGTGSTEIIIHEVDFFAFVSLR